MPASNSLPPRGPVFGLFSLENIISSLAGLWVATKLPDHIVIQVAGCMAVNVACKEALKLVSETLISDPSATPNQTDVPLNYCYARVPVGPPRQETPEEARARWEASVYRSAMRSPRLMAMIS